MEMQNVNNHLPYEKNISNYTPRKLKTAEHNNSKI